MHTEASSPEPFNQQEYDDYLEYLRQQQFSVEELHRKAGPLAVAQTENRRERIKAILDYSAKGQ